MQTGTERIELTSEHTEKQFGQNFTDNGLIKTALVEKSSDLDLGRRRQRVDAGGNWELRTGNRREFGEFNNERLPISTRNDDDVGESLLVLVL